MLQEYYCSLLDYLFVTGPQHSGMQQKSDIGDSCEHLG